jgi:hypothetical protein
LKANRICTLARKEKWALLEPAWRAHARVAEKFFAA